MDSFWNGILALVNSWIMAERRLENIGKTNSAGSSHRRREEVEENNLSKHMALPTLFRAVSLPSGI